MYKPHHRINHVRVRKRRRDLQKGECYGFYTFLPPLSGLNCELDVSVCNTTGVKKCSNGGRCVDGIGASFTCDCGEGWTGIDCGQNVDECAGGSPCVNGGMCMDTQGSYICSCPFGKKKDCFSFKSVHFLRKIALFLCLGRGINGRVPFGGFFRFPEK